MMLFVFFLTLGAVSIVACVFCLLTLTLLNRLSRKAILTATNVRYIRYGLMICVLLLSAWLTVDAFFPGENFYKEEFKTVTLRELPDSAVFLEKHSTYPDFHGDYSSQSTIRLSKDDYVSLLKELLNDPSLKKDTEVEPFWGPETPDPPSAGFVRIIEGEEDHLLHIGFDADGRTVKVFVCVI